MKFLSILALLLSTTTVLAQFSDYFSENSMENYMGTTEKFVITDGELKLNDEAAGTAYISTASECIENAEWQLTARLGFNATSSNYVRYYLISDNENLTENLNGYYVMIGNTDKEMSLYRQKGATKTKIIDGTDKRTDANPLVIDIKVTRSADGKWKLWSKKQDESVFLLEGECDDRTNETAKFSGIFVNYTKTNAQNAFFDNWTISGDKKTPDYEPTFGDVAFTEVMANPTPAVGLPAEKYIEIENLTAEKLPTNGWTLCDGSKKYAFPADFIEPNGIVILCDQKVANDFSEYGDVLAFASFPSLSESGKTIWIEDKNGNLLAWFEYSSAWHTNAFKSNGGWALECIDPNNLSNDAENWASSADKRGGTPGEANSVRAENPDQKSPKVLSAKILTPETLQIVFSEPMKKESVEDVADYSFTNNYNATKAETETLTTVVLTLEKPLQPSEIVSCEMQNLTDLAGNALENATQSFSLVEEIEQNDLIINEFLFGQKPDGLNFIELRNASEKTLDLSDIYLCSRDENGVTAGTLLATEQTPLRAGVFVVICSDKERLCAQYFCNENAIFVAVKSLSSFSTTGGNIILARRNSDIVDETEYTAEMCEQMTGKDIASAERTNNSGEDWHFSSETATPGSENSLPEEEEDDNDDKEEIPNPNDTDFPNGASLAEKSFSPNADGHRDELKIHCRAEEDTYFVKIDIYSAKGTLMLHLVGKTKTELAEPTVFTWDGKDKDGNLCAIGLYMVYVEMQTEKLGVKRYKLPFALTLD